MMVFFVCATKKRIGFRIGVTNEILTGNVRCRGEPMRLFSAGLLGMDCVMGWPHSAQDWDVDLAVKIL